MNNTRAPGLTVSSRGETVPLDKIVIVGPVGGGGVGEDGGEPPPHDASARHRARTRSGSTLLNSNTSFHSVVVGVVVVVKAA
jgi:hypothetical protein